MVDQIEPRFAGVMDHIAVNAADLEHDVAGYQRIGFTVETLYDDWAMLRDARGFGIALLAPGSKHPPHLGLRVESMEELEAAAAEAGLVFAMVRTNEEFRNEIQFTEVLPQCR